MARSAPIALIAVLAALPGLGGGADADLPAMPKRPPSAPKPSPASAAPEAIAVPPERLGPGRFLALEAAADIARADAARRAGVAVSEVLRVASERVTWADGSLGCPQPDVMYTQALVPGYRLRMRAQGREWSYHASERGALLFCPPGMGKTPASGASARA
jgi:hypothetical protein